MTRPQLLPLTGLITGLAVACGSAWMALHPGQPDSDRGTLPGVAVPTATAPREDVAPVPSAFAHVTRPPVRVRIGNLGVDAPVVPVRASGKGALEVPDDPRTLGWWSAGAKPGSPTGTVVVDGHVDSASRGEGSLFTLRDVEVGATVTLVTDDTPVRYRISAVRDYPKATLPAGDLFRRTGAARLVLITCGGAFDRATRHYTDNVVAYGSPVLPPAPG